MTVHGRMTRPIADSPAFDLPRDALPGVDQDTWAASNIPVWAATVDLVAVATGVAIGVRKWLRKGDLVTSITFVSGATPAGTPTHWAHGLYDPDGVLLGASADQLTAAWAANTAKKLALAVPVTIAKDGYYIVATTATATTVQTLIGCAPIVTAAGVLFTGSKDPGVTFGAALNGVFPAAAGALTAAAKVPLAIVS